MRRPPYMDNSLKMAQLQIICDLEFLKIKIELVVITDFLTDDKTDVEAEGMAEIVHGKSLNFLRMETF